MKIRLLITVLTIVLGCKNFENKRVNTDHEIEFVLTKDNSIVDNSEINILVLKDSSDTVKYSSVNNKINLPLYDSSMTFFGVRHLDYKFDLAGDFLKYELPSVISADVKKWYMDIDTLPFEKEIKDSTILYIFRISSDENKMNQIQTYGRRQ